MAEVSKAVKNALLVFHTRMEVNDSTDEQIRLKIKTLRRTLLERQQARATTKYKKSVFTEAELKQMEEDGPLSDTLHPQGL